MKLEKDDPDKHANMERGSSQCLSFTQRNIDN